MPKNKPTKSPKKHYWYLFNVKPGLMCICIITTTKATNLKSLRSTNNVSPHPSLGHSPRTLQPKKQSYQNTKHHYAHPLSHTPSIHMHCLPIALTWTYMICTHKQSPYPPPLDTNIEDLFNIEVYDTCLCQFTNGKTSCMDGHPYRHSQKPFPKIPQPSTPCIWILLPHLPNPKLRKHNYIIPLHKKKEITRCNSIYDPSL